jgi:hypothetical protein
MSWTGGVEGFCAAGLGVDVVGRVLAGREDWSLIRAT